MGVRRFNNCVKNLIGTKAHIPLKQYSHYFIDGNCCLYDVVRKYNDLNSEELKNEIIKKYETQLIKYKFKSKNYHIVFDGVPPRPKFKTQEERRRECSLMSLILPKTAVMRYIEEVLIAHFRDRENVFIYSSEIRGEGEQKIFNLLRQIPDRGDVVVYSVDSDAIILGQIYQMQTGGRVDVVIDPSDEKYYMFVDIQKLNTLFFRNKTSKHQYIDADKLLLFCCMCGNDFFPTNVDIGEGGQDCLYKRFTDHDIREWSRMTIPGRKCTLDCKDVDVFVNVYRWYVTYFTTNDLSLDVEPFVRDTTPCCVCISNQLAAVRDTPIALVEPRDELHLETILSPMLMVYEKSLNNTLVKK